MSEVKHYLASFRLKNFKAVLDSGKIQFTPLTVFIGSNGSGKSSLIEGLETFQIIVEAGLDNAMNRWGGYENIHNRLRLEQKIKSEDETTEPDGIEVRASVANYKLAEETRSFDVQLPSKMMEFEISRENASFKMLLDSSPSNTEVYIHSEELMLDHMPVLCRWNSKEEKEGIGRYLSMNVFPLNPGKSILSSPQILSEQIVFFNRWVSGWQFLTMNSLSLGSSDSQTHRDGIVKLKPDGSNIPEFLLDIRNQDEDAFEGIIETLQNILPHVKDLQLTLTAQLECNVQLHLTEGQAKIPSWLLSTGTQRILALLSLFRHPNPPTLIVIEEIENGLDPRTLHHIVEEIKYVVEEGISQVIFTTHSPYLLDLLSLKHIVMAEHIDGRPTFYRPADEAAVENWSKEFGSGKLYTMGKLRKVSIQA